MQNATAPQPPAFPTAQPTPVVPPSDGATQIVMEGGRPVTALDAATLRNRREELSNQLVSADGRRQELVSQLQDAPAGSQAGLVARIQVLDGRIVNIEQDIALNGQRLAALPATTSSAGQGDMGLTGLTNGQITGISIVFIIMVLMPFAVALARLIWRRGNTPKNAALPDATEQRLQRMEQGVDAIAIEVERISEGQRFVTRLLSERHEMPALGGAAVAEAIQLRREEG